MSITTQTSLVMCLLGCDTNRWSFIQMDNNIFSITMYTVKTHVSNPLPKRHSISIDQHSCYPRCMSDHPFLKYFPNHLCLKYPLVIITMLYLAPCYTVLTYYGANNASSNISQCSQPFQHTAHFLLKCNAQLL